MSVVETVGGRLAGVEEALSEEEGCPEPEEETLEEPPVGLEEGAPGVLLLGAAGRELSAEGAVAEDSFGLSVNEALSEETVCPEDSPEEDPFSPVSPEETSSRPPGETLPALDVSAPEAWETEGSDASEDAGEEEQPVAAAHSRTMDSKPASSFLVVCFISTSGT